MTDTIPWPNIIPTDEQTLSLPFDDDDIDALLADCDASLNLRPQYVARVMRQLRGERDRARATALDVLAERDALVKVGVTKSLIGSTIFDLAANRYVPLESE